MIIYIKLSLFDVKLSLTQINNIFTVKIEYKHTNFDVLRTKLLP